MKVLILGARGMLGQELARAFAEEKLYLWGRNEMDISDFETVKRKISELHPDLIINAAAYNDVDGCEENFELANKINGEGPLNVAKAAQEIGAIFVQYGTDYIFDGSKKDGYLETDFAAPISNYGESKLIAEKAMYFCEKCYLLRTSRLFGRASSQPGAKKSFVEKIIQASRERDLLEVVNEEVASPTYAPDLALLTKKIVENEYAYGIYHVTNSGSCSWYEFAEEIFRQLKKEVKMNAVPSDKFPRPARRPDFSILKNTKLPPQRSWQDALGEFLLDIGEMKPEEKSEEKKVQSVEINETRNMKGIILSGGKGTRLYPLTKITSKQLLPIYDKPMVMFPLETLINAGIKDILMIVSPEYAGHYLNLLGSGKEFGVRITYEIQDEPRGLPEAYLIGERFIGDDNVTMILGDNLFFDHDFTEDVQSFKGGGRIFAVKVPDPERFGVVEFDENKKVLSIEEKPKNPKSDFAIPGAYIYDSRVCHIAKGIKPTWRPETDITEIHKAYLAINELDVKMIKGRWIDAGTCDSLLRASNLRATQLYQKSMGACPENLNQ
ncbi:dTDP-4-dehydrorhamnose reductase [Patescibacteria group bacterium]|nr:dTDP-4-dehydrorhamnose reductase [Patescibacteria group bacterium]